MEPLLKISAECHSATLLLHPQPIDHTSFGVESGANTFNQKVLVEDAYFKTEFGPIILFTGGEGPIESFASTYGFLQRLAKEVSG